MGDPTPKRAAICPQCPREVAVKMVDKAVGPRMKGCDFDERNTEEVRKGAPD
jgi:hypothetical protein